MSAAGDERVDMESILDVHNLTKEFGGLTAVDRVDFAMRKGEILGLIGPNGAGKTTIFNMITGFYTPTLGEIYFQGERIAHPEPSFGKKLLSPAWWFQWAPLPAIRKQRDGMRILRPHDIAERGIARTFQTIRLFKNLTALENVMSGLHHRTQAGVWAALVRSAAQQEEEAFIEKEAHKWLVFMELQGYSNELARNLPYGDQRRLEIARALATGPTLVILDEPAAGLNEQETQELEKIIHRIQDFGITVLLIEHDMKMVMNICERIVVVDHGKKIAEGTPEEIQSNPLVIEAYLGQEED